MDSSGNVSKACCHVELAVKSLSGDLFDRPVAMLATTSYVAAGIDAPFSSLAKLVM